MCGPPPRTSKRPIGIELEVRRASPEAGAPLDALRMVFAGFFRW